MKGSGERDAQDKPSVGHVLVTLTRKVSCQVASVTLAYKAERQDPT